MCAGVSGVAAQPCGERDMVGQELSGSPRLRSRSRCVSSATSSRQTAMSTDSGRRRRQYLAGSHWVASEQQVPALRVEHTGARDRPLGHALSPRHVGHGRHRLEVAQLDGLDTGSQIAGDGPPAPMSCQPRSRRRSGATHLHLRGLGNRFAPRSAATRSVRDVETVFDAHVESRPGRTFPSGKHPSARCGSTSPGPSTRRQPDR